MILQGIVSSQFSRVATSLAMSRGTQQGSGCHMRAQSGTASRKLFGLGFHRFACKFCDLTLVLTQSSGFECFCFWTPVRFLGRDPATRRHIIPMVSRNRQHHCNSRGMTVAACDLIICQDRCVPRRTTAASGRHHDNNQLPTANDRRPESDNRSGNESSKCTDNGSSSRKHSEQAE